MRLRDFSLKNKLVLVSLVCGGLITSIAIASIYFFVTRGLNRVEDDILVENFRTAEHLIENEENILLGNVKDYAIWNDMCDYVNTRNEQWVKDNVTTWVPGNFGVDLILITNAQGRLIYQYGDFTEFMQGKELSGQYLLQWALISEYAKGIYVSSKGAMIVASSPIMHADLSGPRVGTYLYGKLIKEDIDKFRYLSGLNFSLIEKDGFAAPSPPAKRPFELSSLYRESGFIANSGYKIIKPTYKSAFIYGALADITGKNPLLLELIRPRDSVQSFRHNFMVSTFLLFIFIITVIFIVTFVISGFILKPLELLSNAIANIRRGKNMLVKVKVNSTDEIGRLASDFNNMMEQISSMQRFLQEERQRFDAIAIHTKEWIWEVDLNGKYTYSNEAVREILGYEASEILGKHFYDFFLPGEKEQLKKHALENFASGKDIVSFINSNLRKDGRAVVLETNGQPIFNDQGAILGYRGVDFDVTVRKQSEQNLQQAKLQAEFANQAKSQFISQISHEIRTPLNAIMGFTEMLESTPVDNIQKDYLHIIRNSGENLLALIGDVLDVSKIEAGQMELESIDFDLEYLVENVLQMVLPKVKPGVELKYNFGGDIPRSFNGDPTRIRQILLNLLSNAVKFTNAGKITLKVSLDAPGKAEAAQSGGGMAIVRFCVTDTGIGIPKEKQQTIFEKFTQVDASTTRKYGGTGLGLSICKAIVEKIGGEMWVESELGQGSEFFVTLRLKEASLLAGENLLPLAYGQLKGKKIIIVDESENVRSNLEGYCQDVQMVVLAKLFSAEEALHWLDAQAELPQIIICHLMIPGINGYEFAEKIRARADFKEIKLVALDSYTSPGAARKAQEFGFDAYLSSPVLKQSFIRVLRTVLGDSACSGKGQIITRHSAEELCYKGIKILVVEDILTNQKLINLILNRLGCEVEMASNGQEAVEKVKTGKYDMVLMDIQMPVMDGMEATKIIRNQVSRGLPIIALTAAVMEEEEKKYLAAGMNDYLVKPINLKALKEKILKWGKTDLSS